MTTDSGATRSIEVTPGPGWTNLTVLQCELRALFNKRPVNRALAEALRLIGSRLHAEFAVVHARMGVNLLTEEWSRPGAEIDAEDRELLNGIVWSTMSEEQVHCIRLDDDPDAPLIVTAVMYDDTFEQAGAAALVLAEHGEEEALRALLCLEGALGCIALLLSDRARRGAQLAERHQIEPSSTAEHPVRLAMEIATSIKNRYGFDSCSVGFVRRHRTVDVMAISGHDEVRAAHPGVQLIRNAMEECLDRRLPVLCPGRESTGDEDADARLHSQWSTALDGDPVGSFPLMVLDEVVAIVSMSKGAAAELDYERLARVAEEMSGFAALVPLSRAAARTLPQHAAAVTRRVARDVFGRGGRKAIATLALLFAVISWLVFGELRYSFTVSCVVEAADQFVALCPRDGILAELFVRPGDHVRAGQLLAALDVNKDILRRTELRSEIESLDAAADEALAKNEFGQLRIHKANKQSLLAQLAVVEANIEEAQIRAPRDGIVLDGDLREQIGGRLRAGDNLFKLARYDRALVLLKVPERLVLDARRLESARFAPAAAPDRQYELHDLRVAPASTVVDERNVFLTEATVHATLDGIAPGMEGIAYLDAGARPAWWVLTHRLTDWMYLNFWL